MRKSYLLLILFIIGISIVVADLPAACASGSGSSCTCAEGKTHLPVEGDDATHKCYTTTKVTNCQYGNPNSDDCYKCNNGYTFDGSHMCVVEHCADPGSGDDVAKCDKCNPGFTGNPAGGITSCTCSKPTLADDDSTEVCDYVSNCVEYGTDGICTKCKQDYKLEDDDAPSPRITGQQKCTVCANNKGSDGVTCLATTNKISDCVKYGSDDEKCEECSDGKYLQKGGDNDGKCVACTGNTDVKAGNNCYVKNTEGEKENCIAYEGANCVKCTDFMGLDSTDCKPCYYPYVTVGQYCVQIVAHCKDYTPPSSGEYETSTCSDCENGYTLTSDNTCILSTCTNGGGDGGNNNNNGGGAGTNTNTTPSNNPDGSSANMMRLNIIYMAIMLMIIV